MARLPMAMSIGIALTLIAQSIAPQASQAPAARSQPVAVTATASARVLRPAVIILDDKAAEIASTAKDVSGPQRGRDNAGTLWIEFS